MCDDSFDDGFYEDFEVDFDIDYGNDVDNGSGDDSSEECEGWCFGNDLADFAIIGGAIGYLEEELQEKKRIDREIKKEQERVEKASECDCSVPSDEEPYP